MDMTLRERLFRARLQVQSEETHASRTAFLWCVAFFWVVVVAVMLVILSSGDCGLSLGSWVCAVAALLPGFVWGRRHARRMYQHLWP